MKWIQQFSIILLFTFLGELLSLLIPLSVPAGVYGMVILFVSLFLGIVKLKQVEDVADFFIEILPLCFIPAGVGLMTQWEPFRELLLPILAAVFGITILVGAVAGWTTQGIIRRKKRGERKSERFS